MILNLLQKRIDQPVVRILCHGEEEMFFPLNQSQLNTSEIRESVSVPYLIP
jgi:hypothetical protein